MNDITPPGREFQRSESRDFRKSVDNYDASGRLVAASNRWDSTVAVGNVLFTAEEYRHDALGRRVWVRRHRDCDGVGGGYYQPQFCGLSLIRRTVWDGERELIEIQVPGDSTETAYHEVDGTLPIFPLLGALDRNPYWGRVVYTHGPVLDQPLAIARFGYADAATSAGSPWPAFTLVPYWNRRGQAAIGTYGTGQWGLQKVPGGTQCAASPTSPQRCVVLEWPIFWSAFDVRRQTEGLSWHGTLLEDKVNGTGTYYRRNRVYDGKTGRFTQEDPIGLAGGLNLYGYANGDPVNFSDPFGLCPVCVVGAIWAAYEIGSAAYDVYQAYKTVRDPGASSIEKGAMVAAATFSVLGPGGGASVVIGKFDEAGRVIGGLRSGERTLSLPNQGNPRANWAQNSGTLRTAMNSGNPIRDAHVDPRTGALLNDRKANGSGSFLSMERNLLRERGWTYDAGTQHWNPPRQ